MCGNLQGKLENGFLMLGMHSNSYTNAKYFT